MKDSAVPGTYLSRGWRSSCLVPVHATIKLSASMIDLTS